MATVLKSWKPIYRNRYGIISLSRGKSKGRPEGAKRPTAGDEPREFTSRGEGGRVPPFFEKLLVMGEIPEGSPESGSVAWRKRSVQEPWRLFVSSQEVGCDNDKEFIR